MATVVIPALLRKYTEGKDRVIANGRNVGQVIDDLERQYPGLREHVIEDGEVSRRSMVYTEYFARGTEPTALCDLHPTRGLVGTLASLLHHTDTPPPPRAEDVGLAPLASTRTVPTADIHQSSDAPKAKRHFWSAIVNVFKGK